ncbi:unnamed protein product [Colletotrichum noveboracense]|uniref:LysM domain-containing protein n=1 Tax=Colletotrichum noveboracense TaxID=2664923 RepID=A0A9W4WBC5_9PEZI|nr:carbohydrate-binding module family 18 protein [Colletotrichum gloeosporioides 23]CAI0649857.1 unnamed protein product [Colletotrichum noveboracense]
MMYPKVGPVLLCIGTIVTFIATLVHGITPIPSLLASTGTCKPHTWANPTTPGQPAVTVSRPCPTHTTIHDIRGGDTQPGEINCRSLGDSYENVGPETCQELADDFGISLEKFLFLNPSLDRDCKHILPCATYCTAGFIEPERAWDGICGPSRPGVTCVGTDGQCCNSETWRCGERDIDCAPGTCWEGICWGHKVYTTDGTCGYANGNRKCAGKQGTCCSIYGRCGRYDDFCGAGICQSGDCESEQPHLDVFLMSSHVCEP